MRPVVHTFRSAPYTIVLSALIGFAVAPGIIQLWTEGLKWYDRSQPVVRMSAVVLERSGDTLTIELTGEKLRPCEYLGLYAYGVDVGGVLHDVSREKVDAPEDRETRPTGRANFGVWKIWPVRWPSVAMYTRHNCDGRVVVTKALEVPAIARSGEFVQ